MQTFYLTTKQTLKYLVNLYVVKTYETIFLST